MLNCDASRDNGAEMCSLAQLHRTPEAVAEQTTSRVTWSQRSTGSRTLFAPRESSGTVISLRSLLDNHEIDDFFKGATPTEFYKWICLVGVNRVGEGS